MDLEKKKEELKKEIENLSEEVLSSAYKKGFNPNDILCIMCAYKSCMQESKGRNLIANVIKNSKKK